MEMKPKTHLDLNKPIINLMFLHFTRSLKFVLLLQVVLCGMQGCEPKEKPVIQSITFIGLGIADSATVSGDTYGVRRYVHFNFEKDSVSIYRKEFNYTFTDRPGGIAIANFDRFKKDTIFQNLKADTILINFVKRAKTYNFQKFYKEKAKQYKEQIFLCDNAYYFLVRVETDSTARIFNYSSSMPVPEFEWMTKLIINLTEPENLKPTMEKINEYSILYPVLTHPEFSSIFVHGPSAQLLP
jgi:hypothetical protein